MINKQTSLLLGVLVLLTTSLPCAATEPRRTCRSLTRQGLSRLLRCALGGSMAAAGGLRLLSVARSGFDDLAKDLNDAALALGLTAAGTGILVDALDDELLDKEEVEGYRDVAILTAVTAGKLLH